MSSFHFESFSTASFSRFVSHPQLQRHLTASAFTCASLALWLFWLWHNFSRSILFNFFFVFLSNIVFLFLFFCYYCLCDAGRIAFIFIVVIALLLLTHSNVCVWVPLILLQTIEHADLHTRMCVCATSCSTCTREFVDCIRACLAFWGIHICTYAVELLKCSMCKRTALTSHQRYACQAAAPARSVALSVWWPQPRLRGGRALVFLLLSPDL